MYYITAMDALVVLSDQSQNGAVSQRQIRVFTGLLDTLIHLCNVVITGYVQYTFKSLSVF